MEHIYNGNAVPKQFLNTFIFTILRIYVRLRMKVSSYGEHTATGTDHGILYQR